MGVDTFIKPYKTRRCVSTMLYSEGKIVSAVYIEGKLEVSLSGVCYLKLNPREKHATE